MELILIFSIYPIETMPKWPIQIYIKIKNIYFGIRRINDNDKVSR